MKVVGAVTIFMNVSVLILLGIVPFAESLGWSAAEVTPAAYGGMIYIGLPLCLAIAAIGNYLKHGIPLGGSTLASTAFWACILLACMMGWMAGQTVFGFADVSMRGYSLIGVSLFLVNALVLRRSAFVPRVAKGDGRSGPPDGS
jgi:hypothetical protein